MKLEDEIVAGEKSLTVREAAVVSPPGPPFPKQYSLTRLPLLAASLAGPPLTARSLTTEDCRTARVPRLGRYPR